MSAHGTAARAAATRSFPANWPQSPVRHARALRSPAARATAPSFSANLRGGFAIVGNTLLTCSENLSAGVARASDAAACLEANNNDKAMQYVNVDPGGGRFDSSSATLSVPDGSRVEQAYLYWGADLARGVTSNSASDGAPGGEDPNQNPLWRTALLKLGASGGYTTIDATAAGRNGLWKGIASWYSTPGNRPGFAYQVRADVTSEVRAALSTSTRRSSRGASLLDATVANVQAGKGNNRHGGWTLVVVWENETAAWRNLTLFDGFDFVQVQGGQQLVVGPLQFSGFETPTSGPVDAHVTTWTYEGDRAITGDYMSLGNTTSSCTSLTYNVHDAVNPETNFFNSSISRAGAHVTAKNPDFVNQLGFDLDAPSIPEGTIPNSATGASVCLGTVGDTYFFGGLAFDTLIRAPNVQIAKTVDTPTASPGNLVTYSVTVSNPQRGAGETPTDAATNLTIADPTPSGLDFVDFVGNPGTPPACSYDQPGLRVVCNVGTLAPNGSFTFSYRARVAGAAQGPTPSTLDNVACYTSNSQDQPDVIFTGCSRVGIIVPPVPPSPSARRPRRDQAGIRTDGQAGRQPDVDARRAELRTWRLDELHRLGRVAAGRRLPEPHEQPERLDLHDASGRSGRGDQLQRRTGAVPRSAARPAAVSR